MQVKWLLAGNIIYAVGQWLVLIVLTRFFSSIELGWYFFALSLVAPICLVMSLKLPNLVVILEDKYTSEENVIYARYLISVIIIAFSYLLYLLLFNDNTNFAVLNAVLLYKILEQNDDVKIAYLQKSYSFKEIFTIKLFRTLIYVALILLSSIYIKSIGYALLLATLLYSMYWLLRNKNYIIGYRKSYFLESVSCIRKYFKSGIHLSLSSAISSLSTNGIKMYIGFSLGATSLAVYGLVTYNLVAFTIIIAALGQYYLPFFANNQNDSKKLNLYILKSQITVLIIGMLAVVISYFFGDIILDLFYGNEYKKYGGLLVLLFISSIFKSSSALIGTAMTAARIYGFQLKLTIVSLSMTIIIIPLLIREFGMFGAYYGLIIISVLEWILYLISYKKARLRNLYESN